MGYTLADVQKWFWVQGLVFNDANEALLLKHKQSATAVVGVGDGHRTVQTLGDLDKSDVRDGTRGITGFTGLGYGQGG